MNAKKEKMDEKMEAKNIEIDARNKEIKEELGIEIEKMDEKMETRK